VENSIKIPLKKKKRKKKSQALVALACNPSYSGNRDQEIEVQSQPWMNSSGDPISKKAHHKKSAGRITQAVRVPT
jgi:hypothetical protein